MAPARARESRVSEPGRAHVEWARSTARTEVLQVASGAVSAERRSVKGEPIERDGKGEAGVRERDARRTLRAGSSRGQLALVVLDGQEGRGRTLGVSRHGPLALRDHLLDGLGDLGARLGDVVELSAAAAAGEQDARRWVSLTSRQVRRRAGSRGGAKRGRTVSWSKGRASSMFLRVDDRFDSSDSTLVAASLADETCRKKQEAMRVSKPSCARGEMVMLLVDRPDPTDPLHSLRARRTRPTTRTGRACTAADVRPALRPLTAPPAQSPADLVQLARRRAPRPAVLAHLSRRAGMRLTALASKAAIALSWAWTS